MRRFWKPRREDEIERLLRENRAEPRDEFVASVLRQVGTQGQRLRPQLGRRVLVAAAVTALAVGVGLAAGGVHVAGTSISNLVQVGQSGIHGSSHGDNGDKGDKGGKGGKGGKGDHHHHHHHHGGPGDHQYTVPVCHYVHRHDHEKHKGPRWIEIFVSPHKAAWLVKHHPPDYIVGVDGNPTTCPP